jgi:uncharacterized protein (DUF885 family)
MNDEFDALVDETLSRYMDFRPHVATNLGLHQYDKKMPSGTRESNLAFINTISEYIEKFQSITEGLSKDREIDRNVMISAFELILFHGKKICNWEKDPDVAALIGSAIFPLFVREFAPFAERLESITARLQQCPQLIEDYKSRIKTPVHLWVDMAKESCRNLPMFFQSIVQAAHQEGVDTAHLDEAVHKSVDALAEYVAWLDTLPSEEEFRIGKDLFEQLLQVRQLGVSADTILQIGEDYLTKEKLKLKKVASRIDPSLSVAEVRAAIRKDHPPTFDDAFNEYKKIIVKIRTAVCEKGFATIPEGERLIVQETPVFIRHIIPLAAYVSPARFEKDQMGIYFVTPAEKDSLKEHNYSSILNVSIHEGYPGHHLHAVWINKHPSLARILSRTPEVGEGWAHYCEERMLDYGFQDTRLQAVQAIHALFRALRVIIDVKLHCKQMTFDEAVSSIESEIGLDHRIATAEVKRYTRTPGQPLSYLLGKHMMMQLQRDVQEHLKENYSDRRFHDAFLQAGPLPFLWLREEFKVKGMLPV